MEKNEKITYIKWNYTLYSLDTINWVLFSTRKLKKEDYPTDWHLDELFPWYSVILKMWNNIDELLDYIEEEHYTFEKWEKEFLFAEMEKAEKVGIDKIISWPFSYKINIKRDLEESKVDSYVKILWISKKEFIKKVVDWKKRWEESVIIKSSRKFWVKDFSRDDAIKALNWKKFWLEKRKEIQEQIWKKKY